VLRQTAVDPDYIEQNLPASESLRAMALKQLVARYLEKGKLSAAIRLYEEIHHEPEVYLSASKLLDETAKRDKGRAAEIFLHAYNVYQEADPHSMTAGQPSDLAQVIVNHWAQLAPALVLEACDRLLKDADDYAKSKDARSLALSSADGTHVESFYQYRISQLMPVVEALDSHRADSLKKELQAEPPPPARGSDSADSKDDHKPELAVIRSGQQLSDRVERSEVMNAAMKILEEPDSKTALNKADNMQPPEAREAALLQLAEKGLTLEPRSCSEPLDRLLHRQSATGKQEMSFRTALSAATLASKCDDRDRARWFIEIASDAVEKQVCAADFNTDSPNLSAKFYWPCTDQWWGIVKAAYQISPADGDDVVAGIDDEEIRAYAEIFLASLYLKNEWKPAFSPMVVRKKQGQ
jgi:hypothetical protein